MRVFQRACRALFVHTCVGVGVGVGVGVVVWVCMPASVYPCVCVPSVNPSLLARRCGGLRQNIDWLEEEIGR